jgi:pimeloyl-ACP methyl ester carboxylesterase
MLQAFGDGRLFGERTGVAPIEVVGLPGWGRTRQDFSRTFEGFNALAFDLPGFGASPDPPEAWGTAEYARLVAEALVHLNPPMLVVGHSFGGLVAVKLAAARPDLVSGLVLAGVPLYRGKRTKPAIAFRLARWGNAHGLVRQGQMDAMRRRYGSEDYNRADGVMRSVLVRVVNESYESDLAQIECPVELVWGAEDEAVPVEVAERVCGLLKDARLHVVEHAGHITPLAAPDALRLSVQRLLDGGER